VVKKNKALENIISRKYGKQMIKVKMALKGFYLCSTGFLDSRKLK